MTILALIFAVEKHEADVARDQSEQQRRLAVQERLQADEQRQKARLRQVEAIREGAQAAYERGAYLESRAKLRSALELSPSVTPRIRGLWWQLKGTPILWTQPYGSVVYQIRYSHDGRIAAAATQEGNVFLFDSTTGEDHILRGLGDQTTSVTFSHDDRWLASGGYGGRIDLWDVKALKRVRPNDSSGGGCRLAFHPIVTVSSLVSVKIWSEFGKPMIGPSQIREPMIPPAFEMSLLPRMVASSLPA